MKTTSNSIDKSRLFKRAWYLTKNKYGSFAHNLKKAWAEIKEYVIEKTNELAITEAFRNPQNSVSVAWTPSPEAMAAYFNTSSYHGD